ncbi:hypothetical protein [Alloyangia pacifica]
MTNEAPFDGTGYPDCGPRGLLGPRQELAIPPKLLVSALIDIR